MKGYDNANGDSRGILERFLPTIFRKSTDGTPTHNAILGAIKQSIETTRDELTSMSYEVYFIKATGKFLDLYGKYIGLDRLELEDDDTYRGRLLSYVKTQRGTISAIVEGIQSELGKDVNVSIYETWRNIFILNKSNLNGLDYIMGKKYRYGVIEITLDTYVDNDILQDIVNKYKSHGMLVYYKYSLGGTSNVWDLVVDNTENYFLDGDAVLGDKQQVYFKNMKTYLADSPITVSDLSLFKTNTSDLNGSDVLSGNPSNAYLYDKTKSPYFHLIGYVPDNVSVESYPDIYDYVYNNNMVIPGGRNLFISSKSIPMRGGINGDSNVTVTLETFDNTTTMWHIVSPQGKWSSAGIYLFDYAKDLLPYNSSWSYSADIKGMGTVKSFGIEAGNNNPVNGTISNDWSRISQTGKLDSGTRKTIVMYFDTTVSPLDVYIKLPKLELGNVPTPWTPAPEDNDHSMDVYRFGTEPYITLSKEDNNAYTFTPEVGSSPVFAFNMSRILANNGYNDKVKNFSSNQVTEIGIHTKGSETGLPNTTVTAKGNTGTPIAGSFQGQPSMLDTNSSGDYTYRLSTPSQVSRVSLDDYYPYGRSKRVITASGSGTTVPLGIFDTQTTPTMTVPNYATLNKDTITRYMDSVYVNTDVPLLALRIYNFATQRWESIPEGRFNVGNYLKDSISIPGSYLLIKSTVNTIKYLDIDVTLLNLGVTQ